MKRSVTFAVLASATLLGACQDQHGTEAPAPRPVLSVVVAPSSAQALGFAGVVEPRYKSDLGFQVLGRIASREVSVGDSVRKGQRLAALDFLAYQLAVRSAQADVAAATARFENAAATENRQRRLLALNVSTQAQYDAAKQARDTAEAGVTRANADLQKAQEQLGYTNLLAEFDGVVTATQAETGEVVQPGQTVLTIARPDVREAVVDVPEGVGRGLRPGAPLRVALQADPTVAAHGSVREIAPQADPATRTLRVRIALDQPPNSFRLGTTINASLAAEASTDLTLPPTALLERDGTTMVWVVDETAQTVGLRDVAITRDGGDIRVLGGLTPGARIVTAGVHSLTPGQKVKLEDGALP
jgi:RND family efflux transporter MFP subunit